MRQQKKAIVRLIFTVFLVMVLCYGPTLFSQEMETDTIRIEKTEFEPGEDIRIDYRCSEDNLPYLWIGIFKADIDDQMMKDAGLSIKLLGELNSSVLLNAPDTPGNYQACLFSMRSGNVSVHHRLNIEVKEKDDFTPCPDQPVIKYMGQTYNTVKIGNQCWLRENLNVGKMIPGYIRMEDNNIIEKYCYNDDIDNCKTYGGLYQWDELMQYSKDENAQGICPEGWHIPTENDFRILIDYLGGKEIAGEKLKQAGSIFWLTPETGITNESGFSALPGGIGGGDGTFNKLGNSAYFASTNHKGNSETIVVQVFNPLNKQTTEISYTKNESWNLVITEDGLSPDNNNLIPIYKGVAVRCIKNKQEPAPGQPDKKKEFAEQSKKTPPQPCLRIVPIEDTYRTQYEFDATCVSDKEDPKKDIRVRWDWDWRNKCTMFNKVCIDENHGFWDTSWRKYKIEKHHFKHSRMHTVRFQVKDSEGERSPVLCREIKVIGPNPKAAKFEFKPKKGTKATEFTFTSIGSPLEVDHSYKFEVRWDWDWESTINCQEDPLDERTGQWETSFRRDRVAKHRYGKEGTYTVRMQAKDTDGHHYIFTQQVEVMPNTPPHACFKVVPEKGTTKDWFQFDASCSWDNEDRWWDPEDKLKVCWIFNWDLRRTMDIPWSTKAKKVKHQFSAPGDYKVRLGVMDTSGKKKFIFRTVTVRDPKKAAPTKDGCLGLVEIAKEGMAKIKIIKDEMEMLKKGVTASNYKQMAVEWDKKEEEVAKIAAEYESKMKAIAQKRECQIPFKKTDKESLYSIKKITVYDARWPDLMLEIEFSAKPKRVNNYEHPLRFLYCTFYDKNGAKITAYGLCLNKKLISKGKLTTSYNIFYYAKTAIIDFDDSDFSMLGVRHQF